MITTHRGSATLMIFTSLLIMHALRMPYPPKIRGNVHVDGWRDIAQAH
jgi:hypothetical protein